MKNQYDLITISHKFYPQVGGLEVMAQKLVENLSQRGMRSLVIHGAKVSGKYKMSTYSGHGIRTINLFDGSYPVFGIRFVAMVSKYLRLNPEAAVLIHDRHLTSSVLAALVCKIMRRKYTLVSHTTFSSYFHFTLFNHLGNLLDHTVFRFVINGADKVVCVSESNREFVTQKFNLDANKVQVIYNSFASADINKVNTANKEKIVVFATKWIPVKDPEIVAHAFLKLANKHQDWRFVYAGEGDSFIADLDELPANLEIVPRFLPRQELFELLGKSAIYVNSSINEGLSLGVVEAAALGNITVLSDAPSNREVAKNLGLSEFVFTRQNLLSLVTTLEQAMVKFVAPDHATLSLNTINNANKYFGDSRQFDQYLQLLETSSANLNTHSSEYNLLK